MPNHVTNILTIEGEQELVQKCLSEIKGQNEDQYIDFNNFAPMPKELENTQSPIKIISQEEYDAQEARITAGELTEIEKNWGFSRGITQKMSKRFKEEFGADNWYDWHLANWGTNGMPTTKFLMKVQMKSHSAQRGVHLSMQSKHCLQNTLHYLSMFVMLTKISDTM